MNRYQKQLIPLPFPRFIVFYNGEEDEKEEFTMRLSEAFGDQKEYSYVIISCIKKNRRYDIK